MITLSINSIADSIHALTALAAFTSQQQREIPIVITPDRHQALTPLITDTALRVAAQLLLPATADNDCVTIDCDRSCAAIASAMAEVVRNQVLSQIYAVTDPQASQLWQQSALTALTRLTAIVDTDTTDSSITDSARISPYY